MNETYLDLEPDYEPTKSKKTIGIRVNSIDVYGIKEKLRKSKTVESIGALQLIKSLEDALKRQQELTSKAISELRKYKK